MPSLILHKHYLWYITDRRIIATDYKCTAINGRTTLKKIFKKSKVNVNDNNAMSKNWVMRTPSSDCNIF